MTGLANYDGDMQTLADSVNRFFQGVAADLSPLDSILPPPSLLCNDLMSCVLKALSSHLVIPAGSLTSTF